ncbi:unnamed protein product [Phytomonas sp. Hart1]|nr:unnamed protein product [Phytomonas sp. Hart1]|eukprot:CCW69726.1 unnamed protein product [Phytomonas sp. isolate Hart1]
MIGSPEGRGGPARGSFFLASVPGSVSVGLGAVAGSLCPNSALAAAVRPPALANPSTARQLLRNSDGVLWGMAQKYQVHLEEAFHTSRGPRCCPAVLGPLRGIVLLGWDVEELFRTGRVHVDSAVRQMPLEKAWDYLGHLDDKAALVQGHYLLRSVYDEASGFQHLKRIVDDALDENQPNGIDVFQLVGSVNFQLAIKVVNDLLNT